MDIKNPETKQEISDLWAAGNAEELNKRLTYVPVQHILRPYVNRMH